MKVRVKLSGAARVLDVGEIEQCTLLHLCEQTADAFQLGNTPFSLSLNKKDSLNGNDRTLSELGIVPGDLIFVLQAGEHETSVSDHSSTKSASTVAASAPSSSGIQGHSVSDVACDVNTSGCNQSDQHRGDEAPATVSQEHAANDETLSPSRREESDSNLAESDQGRDCVSPCPLEDPVVNRCLMEPLLCRESLPNSVPAQLRDIFDSAGCITMADALWVVVHTLMLEVGFKPVQGTSLGLEEGWNTHGFYKQEYRHLCVNTQHSCTAIGMPMGQVLVVNGVTNGDPPQKTDAQQLKISDFVQGPNIGQDVCYVFKNMERLSRVVKDSVCQQLLSQLSEVCGYPVSLGLLSLSYELRLKVLSYLPASSLTKMGQVCREYSVTYKDPFLWRRLYLREFGQNGDNSLNKNWYQLYKDAYQRRKERRKLPRHRQQVLTGIPPWLNPPPGHFPPLTPAPYPGGIIGGDYDLNPEFTSGIPHPLFGRPRTPNPFLPQVPGAPRGPFLPRPRFDDPFGPGAGPGPPFMSLGSGSSRNSRASPFGSLGGNRFL